VPVIIVQASDESEVGFKCYGGAAQFWASKEPELILEGPYETGKTYAALQKLNALLSKYPNTHALMVRQTYKSLLASAVVTFEKKVLLFPPGHRDALVTSYGKNRPEWYDYPNGSRLVLGGMDNADKFLSSEFDLIYVNQAEEIGLDSWEKLTSRATGRAGNMPYSQVMGDCNPGDPLHWIKQRPGLILVKTRHSDNPTLFDHRKEVWTAQGERTIGRLKKLTGARYKRGYLGLWVGVEGQVYEHFDPNVHILPSDFHIPKEWPRYRVIDFGFRNPFVCQFWAVDEDGRMYLYKEIYHTNRTVRAHAGQIHRASGNEEYEATIADHDAEDRATLEENGISTRPAKKAVLKGIDATQERFKIQDDGRPRIYFLHDARIELDRDLEDEFKPTCTIEEITGYVYDHPKEGKAFEEKPIKYNDHGMDAMRYLVAHLHRKRNLKVEPKRYA